MRFLAASCLHLRLDDSPEKLRQIGKELAAGLMSGVETLVLNGDIADDIEMYEWMRGAAAGYKYVLFVPGNHDERTAVLGWITLNTGYITIDGVKFMGFTGFNYGDHCWFSNTPGNLVMNTRAPSWASAHTTTSFADVMWKIDDIASMAERYKPDVLITHYPFAYINGGGFVLEVLDLNRACYTAKRVLFGHAHNAWKQIPISIPGMLPGATIDNVCAVSVDRPMFTEVIV